MAEEKDEQPKKKMDMGKILGLVFVVLNLVVVGIGGFLVYNATLGYEKKVLTEAELNEEYEEFRKSLQSTPVLYSFEEPFSTNLSEVPRRVIRVEVSLEMLDQEGFEEVIDIGAEARDSIVKILNSKTFEQLESVQGKLHLKNQITAEINQFLTAGVVKNVYFSDFVIQ